MKRQILRMKKRTIARKSRIFSLTATAVILAALLLGAVSVQAAETNELTETPTYTVRVYAGNQGTISGGDVKMISVPNVGTSVDAEGFDMDAEVQVKDSRYYAKGIRLSGADNSTYYNPANGITSIKHDTDYVVAYGIKGKNVEYTVNYVNAATGETLAASDTFHGSVGDVPVIAYKHIEGYYPNARSLTDSRGLSENSANNVFTFRYQPNPTPTPAPATTTTTTTTVVQPAGTTGTAGAAGATGTEVGTPSGAGTAGGTGATGTEVGTPGGAGAAGGTGATGTEVGTPGGAGAAGGTGAAGTETGTPGGAGAAGGTGATGTEAGTAGGAGVAGGTGVTGTAGVAGGTGAAEQIAAPQQMPASPEAVPEVLDIADEEIPLASGSGLNTTDTAGENKTDTAGENETDTDDGEDEGSSGLSKGLIGGIIAAAVAAVIAIFASGRYLLKSRKEEMDSDFDKKD